MRAESEKNKNKSHTDNRAFIEDMPAICECNTIAPNKTLFASKWFSKDELTIRVKL
jgi:hypothetical protein